MSHSNYDSDFYAWANEQAALLRSGRVAQADIEHIALEIESMGRTEKRELVSRLRVLLLHLLKWRLQLGGVDSGSETGLGGTSERQPEPKDNLAAGDCDRVRGRGDRGRRRDRAA